MLKDFARNVKKNSLKNFLFLFLLLSFFSCIFSKKIDDTNYFIENIPPGTVKIGENLFYDETESRNLDWLEYLYWIRRVFGANSEEYLSAKPDTSVWVEKYPCLNLCKEKFIHHNDTIYYNLSYTLMYLRHPQFRYYPVVGISQEQAKNYAKWRSDRVFEGVLIKYGKLKMNALQNKDNYFSVENYYNGKYNGCKPDSNFMYYPVYRLPTVREWQYAMHYADSVNKAYYKKHPRHKCNNCKTDWSDFQSDIIPCINDSFVNYPTVPVLSFKGSPFYNLRGNVSEWTSEKNVCVGGGWADSKERILANDTFMPKTQNAWTGFRNVCEWKVWGK
ncbi:MAG: SUMF1/EgtB/PvdO family nonheme iron enzyme [Bacteroidota bacterium]